MKKAPREIKRTPETVLLFREKRSDKIKRVEKSHGNRLVKKVYQERMSATKREKSDQEEIRIGFFEKCLLFLVYRLSEDNSGHEPAGMREDE